MADYKQLLKEQLIHKPILTETKKDDVEVDKNKLQKMKGKMEKYLSDKQINVKEIYKVADKNKSKIMSLMKNAKSGDELFNGVKSILQNSIKDDFWRGVKIGIVIAVILVLIRYFLIAPLYIMTRIVLQAIYNGIKLLYRSLKPAEIKALTEDEFMSDPVDLNPQPCDNVDPKKELANKIDFINKKLEDVLMNYNGDPDPLNKKFDIDGVGITKEDL